MLTGVNYALHFMVGLVIVPVVFGKLVPYSTVKIVSTVPVDKASNQYVMG